jgi:hypothetical protein
MPEMTKEQARALARGARRNHLPWDEFPEYCSPGGLADRLDDAIADLILQQRAEAAAEERARVVRRILEIADNVAFANRGNLPDHPNCSLDEALLIVRAEFPEVENSAERERMEKG